MLTRPGTSARPNCLSFINNELAGIGFLRPVRQLGLALLAATLLMVMAACGTAASNKPTPPSTPTIASFSPASGIPGISVTVLGTNFTGATAVKFNGKAAGVFFVDSATQLRASVASGTTSGTIAVTTAAGTATSTASFTVLAPPTITSFNPASGVAGNSVTITGTNFTGATSVRFNATAVASFTVDSATQITAVVGNGSTTGRITVTTPAGTATSATSFTITNAPTISSFNPASGAAGTSVTITGTNFTGATSVKFNSTAAASFTVNSATQITATVGNGTTTGQITVTTPAASALSASSFTIVIPPTISALNPGSGPVGTAVIVTGTNFTGVTAVAFNGKAASGFTVNSATQITATVAAASTTGKVTVTTAGGTATSVSNFTVTSGNVTLDLSIEGLYLTQATQEYPNPIVPLVQSRSAWVRVFVKANQTNTVAPQVKVDFINGGVTTHTLTINASGASVPLSIDPENAAASWNAAVDQSWIVTGTQVVATVDPGLAIPEADETNNTFSQTLNVHNLKPWKITLIPVQSPDGTGNVQNSPRTKNDWVDFAKRIHPVPDAIDVTVGNVFVTTLSLSSNGTNWDKVLSALDAKRTADGVTDRYYFGAVRTNYNSGVAGLGYIGWPVAIGWDVNGSFPSVLAHEVGHNFNDQHSPCGGPNGVDPNYPYAGAIIGVPGWDVFASSNNLKGSAAYVDIMSYCSPVWISDYVYTNELTFRQNSPIGIIVPGPGGDVVSGDGLLVWGRIINGQLTLEPAFRIPANNSLATPGPYTWEARDAMGRVLASVSFSAAEVADSPDDASVRMFSFVVPLKPEILAAMQSMHVKSGYHELASRTLADAADFQSDIHIQDLPNGALQIVWDADRYPVLMLRDAKTGEVRGFVRDGNAQIDSAPNEIVVHAPDNVRSDVARHQRVPE